tara:strand:+ start:581 stop:1324 length:744 start_codon:yes stop_codon:yes gene_type:complete
MKIEIITTYNNILFDKYAHRFISSYNLPFDLKIYNEDQNMFELIPECNDFVKRNKHRKPKSFLYDGVRFCYKIYAFTHAILNSKADGLICLDADTVFYNPFDINFVKNEIHSDNCMMSYLGRGNDNYSEYGFIYFNLKHPKIKNYALEVKRMYDEDIIYNEKEQHDSYIWDLVRLKFEKEFEVKNKNLGDNKKGHVQKRSILSKYFHHNKSELKKKKIFEISKSIKLRIFKKMIFFNLFMINDDELD